MTLKSGFVLFILYFVLSGLQADPLVTISQGFLKGTTSQSRNGRNFSSFLGIPYAQPPIGELRFRNPEPGKPWDGIRMANKEEKICPQSGEKNIIGDEDCLYLNVHTPIMEFNSSMPNSKLLPVMVWIHEGGLFFGSGNPSFHGPKYLLDKDIVLVSINYRLGILGFLTTGDLVAPGNFGLKDQVLALKWVKKNIKNFGGNRNRVTIFGQSAGGSSVNFHAISDASNGLFQQYIIQSGTVLSAEVYRNRTHFKPYLNTVAKNVGCSMCNSEVFVNCLRKQNVDKLLNSLKVENEDYPIIHWIATDEPKSKDAFLTDSPQNLIAQNKMKDLPFISGTVADEGLVIAALFYGNMTSAPIKNVVGKTITLTAKHYVPENRISNFKKSIEDYYFSGSTDSLTDAQLLKNYTKFISDSEFFYPQVLIMEKMAKIAKSPFYSYSFGYHGNNSYLSLLYNIKENLGVTHGDDLIYLYPEFPSNWMTKKDEKIIDLMVDFWTSFATNGKPTSGHLDNPDFWMPYKQNNSFLQIGDIKNNTIPSLSIEHDFFTNRMNFWKKNFRLL